jgi:branched-chain amino acid transport system substrate-binding protein
MILHRYSLLLLLLCCLLPACSKKEPVKIGFLAGMSGRSADLGVAGRNGAMLAIEQRNAAGGIKGQPLELLVKDDEQNPETARKVMTELLSHNLELIIGPMTSSVAAAVLPQVNSSKTILLSPTVTATELTGKDDQFLRVIADTSSYATKSADFQYKKMRSRTVAALYDQGNRSYTESWLNDFKREFEKLGGRLLLVKSFTSGSDVVFQDMAKGLLAVKPDTVLIIANAVDAALVCQQIRKLSKGQSIITSEWASTERFIELAGAVAEGVHVTQFIDRNNQSPRYLAFVKAYKERFGGQEPGFAGMAGYDAVQVTLDALQQRTSGQSLKDALLSVKTFEGAQQQIVIDRFGDANRKNYVTEVRNGHFITLE